MTGEPLRTAPDATEQTWRHLDALLEELAALVRSEATAHEFYARFLGRVVSGLAADGGAVWTRGPAGALEVRHCVLPAEPRAIEGNDARQQRRRLATAVLLTGKTCLLAPRSVAAGDEPLPDPSRGASFKLVTQAVPAHDSLANPTDFLLLLCPWQVSEESGGVLEIWKRPGADPGAARGQLEVLEAVCELVADFHRRHQLREYRNRLDGQKRLDDYARRGHGSLDVEAVAYTIANEGRRLTGWDRMSVLVRRGSRCRLAAISGVDMPHRRSSLVQAMERLSAAVAAVGEPLWHPDASGQPQAPQIEALLAEFLDESHARGVGVIPLVPPRPEEEADSEGTHRQSQQPGPVGVLVVEQFQKVADESLRGSVDALLAPSALALRNARELDRLPLAGLLRRAAKVRWLVEAGRMPKTVLALLVLAGVVAALVLVPADFAIEARGELQPLGTRDVFAPADGVVAELKTAHAAQVRAGQILLTLRKAELDYEFQRVWGELQAAKKRLASVEAERLQGSREDDQQQRRRHGQLTAQREELLEVAKSLEAQYAILQKKQSELEVRSPIDGEVLTWNLEPLLAARPVSRGQVLLTVADLAGPWGLELRIPDHHVAHVLAAQEESGPELGVRFALATDPGTVRQGNLRRLGARSEAAEKEGAFVPAHVDIRRDELAGLIPGATVTAKIQCGRRAVGYVWLHDLIDAVKSWLLF